MLLRKRMNSAIWVVAILCGLALANDAISAGPVLKGKKIAMVIANSGFNESEFSVPKEAFEKAGATVRVVAQEKGEAISTSGVSVSVGMKLDDLSVSQFDAIVFIGGNGAGVFFDDKKAHAIAKDTLRQGKLLSAICAATTTLAHAGVLKGKKATGWYKAPIEEHGGQYSTDFVVEDGRIITGMGSHASKAFAEKIILALQ